MHEVSVLCEYKIELLNIKADGDHSFHHAAKAWLPL
jgi:hypothetical protein